MLARAEQRWQAIVHVVYKPRVVESIARLIEYRGDQLGRAHDLGLGTHVLGRSAGVDVFLDHADVSRQHAELRITAEGATLRDLASKNGVQMFGHKITDAVLEDGSWFMLGDLRLVLEHPAARIERVLQRSGEPTVRRPPQQPLHPVSEQALDRRRRALLLAPTLAAIAFALLLIMLLVYG
jgi:DNA segregation ATPase FtsK/SpoIIIE, S-DNA-T family